MTDEELIALADGLFNETLGNMGSYAEWGLRSYREGATRSFIAALTAAHKQGWRDGIDAAARYIQDEYPHDKRALVPAIRAMVAERGE